MFAKIKKWTNASNVFMMTAMIAAAWLTLSSIGVMTHNYDLQRQVNQAKTDNEILAIENENLKLQQSYYQTDEFLELQSRALLGRAAPGERVIILPQHPTENSPENAPANNKTQDNFAQWMEFLFGSGREK